jgi:hypothetical protein
MPIVGENTHSLTVLAEGTWGSSASMEINVAPSDKYLKTFLSEVNMRGNGVVWVGIWSIRRRLADGSEERITFPNGTSHYFNYGISSITFGMSARDCGGKGTLVIEHWK